MFIPYSTDAPLYHWPLATGGIIIANIAIFFSTTFLVMIGYLEPEQIDWLLIQFNQINPLQWITGSFMHLGFGHLLGNMFFLFCFGLIVEGKIGNMMFLAIYFAACALIGAVAQVPMFLLGSEDAAAGASGVISTLMVVAFFWAPENDISFFYCFFLLIGVAEARVMTVCMYFIGMDVLTVVFSGFAMSGAMGHVIGALLGIPIGIAYLRTDRVECEGWDLISRNDWLQEYPILYGDKQRTRDRDKNEEFENPVAKALEVAGGDVSKSQVLGLVSTKERKVTPPAEVRAVREPRVSRKRKRVEDQVTPEQLAERCQAHPEFQRLAYVFRDGMQKNNWHAVQDAFMRLDAMQIGLGLSESSLMQYATALGQQKRWVDAIRPLAILIEKRDKLADDACLRLAQIQLRVLKRKDQASITLHKITNTQGAGIDTAKGERIKKRDELLEQCRDAFSPYG